MSTDLDERYGVRRGLQARAVVVASVVLVLTFGGWLGWVIWDQSQPAVASGNLTYDEDAATDGEIVARFTIDMADDVVEATCTLEAYGVDRGTRTLVGSLTFLVPRGTTQVEQAVATERRAVRVELVGCTAPGQNRPR